MHASSATCFDELIKVLEDAKGLTAAQLAAQLAAVRID